MRAVSRNPRGVLPDVFLGGVMGGGQTDGDELGGIRAVVRVHQVDTGQSVVLAGPSQVLDYLLHVTVNSVELHLPGTVEDNVGGEVEASKNFKTQWFVVLRPSRLVIELVSTSASSPKTSQTTLWNCRISNNLHGTNLKLPKTSK